MQHLVVRHALNSDTSSEGFAPRQEINVVVLVVPHPRFALTEGNELRDLWPVRGTHKLALELGRQDDAPDLDAPCSRLPFKR